MDAKKKLHIVIILPVLVTMMIVGALLFFILTTGGAGGKVFGLEHMAHSGSGAVIGSAGVSEGHEGAAASSEPMDEFLGRMAQAPVAEDVVSDTPAPECSYGEWVGQDVNEEAVKATGRPYRILKPGDMATMDYSPERINVLIDDSGKVMAVRCG